MSERVAKPGWRRAKFGEFAENINDRVDDPQTAGVDRYVGLEHLDPGRLRITRWGQPSDVEATKLRFKPGDIIFGRRRAYQRKLAVADFDGICSAHAMVLRARPTLVESRFLPFFLQGDTFMQRAQAISVGSLSPTVNWKTLAAEEFDLPPMSEQTTLIARLEAIEAALEAGIALREQTALASTAIIQRYATGLNARVDVVGQVIDRCVPKRWRRFTIRQACSGNAGGLTLGPFGSDLTIEDYGHLVSGTPVLFVADVQRFRLVHESGRFISTAKHMALKAHEALPGDVLITEMGWPPGEACVVPEDWPASIVKADIIRARPNRDIVLPGYLAAILNSYWGQQQVARIAPGTTRPRMTLRDFEGIGMVLPPLDLQKSALDEIERFQRQLSLMAARLAALRDMKACVWEEHEI